MTLVDGIWYDNQLNYGYGDHDFILLPNSEGIKVVTCCICLQSRMYLQLMDVTVCQTKTGQRSVKE